MTESLRKAFAGVVGAENLMTDPADLATYSCDAAVADPATPALVVRPASGEGPAGTVRLCNENRLPLTVRGAGANLGGETIPAEKGVVILTNGLNRIPEINEADMYAVVQPGVVTAKFATAVEATGPFYPPGPGSQAASTLGSLGKELD